MAYKCCRLRSHFPHIVTRHNPTTINLGSSALTICSVLWVVRFALLISRETEARKRQLQYRKLASNIFLIGFLVFSNTKKMAQIINILHELKPALLMVVVQVLFAGVNVLYKLAANDGMSLRVIVAYRFIFGTAIMIPLALIAERKRPKLTWTVLVQIFFCGLLGGSLFQILYIESMAITSATFVSAMYNLIPAVTFIVAITLGLEKLASGTMAGRAKVLGTLIGIGGAMLLTFFKGFQINMASANHLDLLRHGSHGAAAASPHPGSAHHLLGALLALGSCISYALWLNFQAKVSEKYPCYYSSTALTCAMAAMQTTIFALCTEKDRTQWKLGWNVRLLTVAYAGVLVSGLMYCLISWCVQMRGPLYASVFNPLVLILVAFAGSLFLEEKLYLGSLIGAVLIVIGLYVVLWGKGKELKKMSQLVPSHAASCPENRPIEIIVSVEEDRTSINSNDSSVATKDSPKEHNGN